MVEDSLLYSGQLPVSDSEGVRSIFDTIWYDYCLGCLQKPHVSPVLALIDETVPKYLKNTS